MEKFTVSLFGHRYIEDHKKTSELLEKAITEVLTSHSNIEFLVGKNGEFDILCASVIKQVRKKLNRSDCYLVLILPYSTASFRDNEEYYLDYYDEVEIYSSDSVIHPKSAITKRNRFMADRSDLVIAYVTTCSGGAFSAIKYAAKSKTVWNLAK